jgi:hypothetical protein
MPSGIAAQVYHRDAALHGPNHDGDMHQKSMARVYAPSFRQAKMGFQGVYND